MTNAGDSAEQMVKLSLNGTEVVVKLAGEGLKNLAMLLYTMSKDKSQTVGKARLLDMLKTGKEQKIFSIKAKHLAKFKDEAKTYGVMYCALIDKKDKNPDKMVDIMVKAEDASKVNRIVERFNLYAMENIATARAEIGKVVDRPQLEKTEKKSPSKSTLEGKGNIKPSVKKKLDKISNDIKSDVKAPPLTKDKSKGGLAK